MQQGEACLSLLLDGAWSGGWGGSWKSEGGSSDSVIILVVCNIYLVTLQQCQHSFSYRVKLNNKTVGLESISSALEELPTFVQIFLPGLIVPPDLKYPVCVHAETVLAVPSLQHRLAPDLVLRERLQTDHQHPGSGCQAWHRHVDKYCLC